MALNRDTVGVLLIAVLAVAGLGFTAATVDSTYSSQLPGAGDGPGGDDQGDRLGGDSDLERQNNQQVNRSDRGSQDPLEIPEVCIEAFTRIPVILGMIVGILAAIGLAYRQFGFIGASFVAYLLGVPATLGYGFVTQCGPGGGSQGGGSVLPSVVEETLGGAVVGTPVPPAILIGIFAVAAVGAVVALVSATGSEDIEPPSEDEEEEPDLGEFAAAAGAAADRIESTDASVDNAVYRAWQEMTDLLDLPNPESSTSGEFADAAVEAGMGEEDVSQLTRLFEEVRYGDMDPEPREDLALETLRGIEERYGVDPDEQGTAADPDTDGAPADGDGDDAENGGDRS